MAPNTLSILSGLAVATYVAAQSPIPTFPPTPLNQLHYPSPTDAPYQVFPPSQPYVRGPQTGYNICNSTTEGASSMCQTSYVNSISDFCLWGPPEANTAISDSEGEEVAWCTQPGHGTRIMPAGTLLGVQVLMNNDYWMITGNIAQTNINMQDGDYGGELDSGGQDERGNPIGGLIYSTAFVTNSSENQILWWTEFIGSDQFCMKICNPNGSNEAGYCQHTLDRIGLGYNCPSKYTLGGGYASGEFEVCESADMTVPGVYVDSSGTTQSYAQPAESLGPITTMPFSAGPAPSSSSCTTYASTDLFSLVTGSASAAPTGSASGSASPSKITSAASNVAKASGSATASGAAPSGSTNGALPVGVSFTAIILAVVSSFVLA